MESNPLQTFGDAMKNVSLWGASDVNPDDMRNNCVSVALAHLLGYNNVYELWAATYGGNLPDEPLPLLGIADLLDKTGWKFKWEIFFGKGTQSVFEAMLSQIQCPGIAIPVLLYGRANNTGHAVNALFRKEPPLFNTKLSELRDYQRSKDGTADLDDLKHAVRICAFSLVSSGDKGKEDALADRIRKNQVFKGF